MTRTQNLEAMFEINRVMARTTDPMARKSLSRAHYLHRIVEAILTNNVASLPTTVQSLGASK